MGKDYWIGRQSAEIRMARAATSAEARLIHYELAGRYSFQADLTPPFMIPRKQPATEGEGIALRPPVCSPPPWWHEPGEPDGLAGGRR
jgi:hypothetical protein